MDFSGDSSSVTSLPSNGVQGADLRRHLTSNIHLIYFKENNISLSCVLSSGSLVVIIIGAWNLSAYDKQDNMIPPCQNLIAPFIHTSYQHFSVTQSYSMLGLKSYRLTYLQKMECKQIVVDPRVYTFTLKRRRTCRGV